MDAVPTVVSTTSLASGAASVADEPELNLLPPTWMIPELEADMREAILDVLFEPSEELHKLSVELLAKRKFETYEAMVTRIGVQLEDLEWSTSPSDLEILNKILESHPRLGATVVDSVQSQAEQAQLQSGTSDEANQLTVLNELYEAKFRGLRYVVFVNRQPRSTIMADMQERIQNSTVEAERAAAIKAMCDIASDRAKRLRKA